MSHHVVIGGGGVGGLELAFALKSLAGDRIDLTMVAPERHFVYRPLSTGEPFGGAATVQIELARIAQERGFELVRDAVDRVDADARRLHTQDGLQLVYDSLVLGLGARTHLGVPGALTFRGPRDVKRIGSALRALEALGHPRIVFVVAAGSMWTLPLYELALLTATQYRDHGVGAEILIVTTERAPLEIFGSDVSRDVTGLLAERGIRVLTSTIADRVEDGALQIPIEGSIPADLVVALPRLTGPEIPGIPRDDLGFVPVDEFCRVVDVDRVFAIGDMAAHDLKQGGLAAQQADVVAKVLAAELGLPVTPEPYTPVLRALMFTGASPRYLRSPGAPSVPVPAGDNVTAPWWPPHKIVGTHLGPYLATHADLLTPVNG